jgi:hypothetical protein
MYRAVLRIARGTGAARSAAANAHAVSPFAARRTWGAQLAAGCVAGLACADRCLDNASQCATSRAWMLTSRTQTFKRHAHAGRAPRAARALPTRRLRTDGGASLARPVSVAGLKSACWRQLGARVHRAGAAQRRPPYAASRPAHRWHVPVPTWARAGRLAERHPGVYEGHAHGAAMRLQQHGVPYPGRPRCDARRDEKLAFASSDSVTMHCRCAIRKPQRPRGRGLATRHQNFHVRPRTPAAWTPKSAATHVDGP